jgi:predicted thioesterase
MQARLHVVVAPHMTVNLGGKKIHPFYSTYTATHHAEMAARLVLEPYIEPDEEGIGSGLTIQHHSPALIGQELEIVATSARVRAHHLATTFEIRHGERLIASGEVHQVVVPKTKVEEIHDLAKSSPQPTT